MGISDRQCRDEMLLLARAIKSIRQAKALTNSYRRLSDLDERERNLIESLLQTIFNQEGERTND